MRLASVMVLVVAALAPAARADSDAENRARAHYEIGLGMYRLGDYRGAVKEFTAGYELARKPGFLLNLGQSYRKLGDLPRARAMYRQFLDEAPASDPARPQVRQVLSELDAAIGKAPPAAPTPAATTREPAAPATNPPAATTNEPTAPATTANEPTSSPTTTADTSPPAAAALSAPPAVHAAAHPHRRALRIAGITVGIAGVGLLGGGLGAAFAADSTARDLDRLDQSGGLFDPGKDSAYHLDRTLEGVCFGVGGALAATGIVLLIVSAR